jgi:carboxypeptidase Q
LCHDQFAKFFVTISFGHALEFVATCARLGAPMAHRSSFVLLALSLLSCSAPSAQPVAASCAPCPTCVTSAATAAIVAAPNASASVVGADKPAVQTDPIVDKLQSLARSESRAYDLVRSLVDEAGSRLSGSPGDKAAVIWGVRTMKELGLQNVRAEKVMVPHWERGAESGRIVSPAVHNLVLTALGGSVATKGKGIEADVVMADSLDALKKLDDAQVKGKIVFFSTHMERTHTGRDYGRVAPMRAEGAIAAAKKGAVAVVIRSVGTDHDRLPHTGGMKYEKGVPEIPAAALAVPDAELLERLVMSGKTVRLAMSLGAKTFPDAESANIVGEVVGREKPDEIVLLGAHLDSWDAGVGALDDGAGCAAVIEAARILTTLPTRPRRTVRVVLFANEENGLRGAKKYAVDHAAEVDKHQLALEVDLGSGRVHTVRFLGADGSSATFARIAGLLTPLGVAFEGEPARGGADTSPLLPLGVPIADLHQDATTYFDIHHTANDTLAQVSKSDLDQVVAAVVTVAWVAADSTDSFARVPADRRERKK